MKALTLYQPYALLIVTGEKKIETRPRKTNIRGTIAIHAGKKPVAKVLEAMPQRIRQKIEKYIQAIEPLNKWVYGAVIGTVEIIDCVPVEQVRDGLTEKELTLGGYDSGRWAWILGNPVRFERPIPATGRQGWFNWGDEDV